LVLEWMNMKWEKQIGTSHEGNGGFFERKLVRKRRTLRGGGKGIFGEFHQRRVVFSGKGSGKVERQRAGCGGEISGKENKMVKDLGGGKFVVC